MTSFSYPTSETILDRLMKGVESIYSTFGPSPLYPPPPTREVVEKGYILLKTIIPSRKATRAYKSEQEG